jgi:hypothetical protein
MDPDADPDPSFLIHDLEDANKKIIKQIEIFCILVIENI